MSKRNLSKILIILIVTLIILAGILLYFFVFSKKSLEPIIEIKSEDEIHKTLSIKALNLSPGENKKYTIKILNRSGSDYNFSLEFVQKGEGRLYNFIDVEMSMGDKTVKRSLKDLFEGEIVKFEKEKSKEIIIKYILPETVGNEAQGAQTSFDIELTISRN